MAAKIIHLSRNPAEFGKFADVLDPSMFDSDVPVQHTHLYHEDDDHGFYVGVWDTTSMIESAGPYPCDEFMLLLEGEAAIENNATGEIQRVRAGQAFVIPRGYSCRWRQQGYLRKFFVILEPPGMELPSKPVVAGIIKPAVSSASISKEVFPLCDKINAVAGLAPDYCDSSGLFSAGSWAGLDFEFGPITTAAATFMVLLEGSLSIDEVGSAPHEFGPGDAFFVPAGTACSGAGQQRVHLCYATVRIQK